MRRGCVNVLALIGLAMAFGCCRSSTPAAKAPNQTSAAASAASPAPTTAEGCRACNGDFGPHGIDQTPRCNCRTHDVGTRCRGKQDCEGECIGDLGEREVTAAGPPPMGFRLGHCAEFHTSFGCHTFLPPTATPPVPVRLDQPPEQVCVD